MEIDPDYTVYAVDPQDDLQEERSKILEENAREAAVGKIKNIINEQFDKEIQMKENELTRINQKLADARCVMDRLRACVVASFYAASFTKPVDGANGPDSGAAYHPAIQNVMRKAVTSVLSKNAPYQQQPKEAGISEVQGADVSVEETSIGETENNNQLVSDPAEKIQGRAKEIEKIETETEKNPNPAQNLGGRQRIKKTIIVGNVSKYIPSDQRESSDKSTHKWMVYVRGSKEEPRIGHFVRKVWFFLHPSYRPNDLVEVCEAPFHLTRRGWGEFPIRVQIHFCDRRNRPVDIIHGLRLDRTYTGLQTLGAETVCEVELDRSSVQLMVDDILEVSRFPHLDHDDTLTDEHEKEKPQDYKTEKENAEEQIIATASKMDTDTTVSKMDTDTTTSKMDADTTTSKMDADTDAETSVQTADQENTTPEVIHADQHQFQPIMSSCTTSSDTVSPPRKRKLEEDESSSSTSPTPVVVAQKEESDREMIIADEEAEDEPTPHKRKRKRRRDSCRASASEDDVPSGSTASKSSADESDRLSTDAIDQSTTTESVTISRTLSVPCHKEDAEEELDVETADESLQMRIKNAETNESQSASKQDDSGSSDISNVKQPIAVIPRSPIPGTGFFRMRAASDGEGLSSRSCANLIKSAVSVTPVINVKLNSDASSSCGPDAENFPVKKVTVTSPKSVILQGKGTSSQPIVISTLPFKVKTSEKPGQNTPDTKPVSLVKKVPAEPAHPGHITIPLSSLLKCGASQAHLLKLTQPSSTSGQTFSVNMLRLANQNSTAKPREKRSFSADHLSPHAVSLASSTVNTGNRTHQPIQLHIISPQNVKSSTVSKKNKPTPQPAITSHTLQVALSSGSLSLTQPKKTKPEGDQSTTKQGSSILRQQYVLATVVNPKGKQQLALINPSTLSMGSSKKIITIMSPKGRKSDVITSKQALSQKTVLDKGSIITESQRPIQEERSATQCKPEPFYKVIGDQIHLYSGLRSLEDILQPVVKKIPLIDVKRDTGQLPFCAKTESDFLEWNVGKQRASEWQRASLVQKVLKYIQGKSDALKECQLPSKKFIMNWCLRHGYSVFTDEYVDEIQEDKNNDERKEVEMSDLPSTLTSVDGVLKLLEAKEKELSKENKPSGVEDDDVVFVDVVNVDSPAKRTVDVKSEPSENVNQSPEKVSNEDEIENRIRTVAESLEVSATEEMTREIGIHLHRTYGMPVCHIVLAKALKLFTESLLKTSLSCALKRRDGSVLQRVAPEEIDLRDVVSAIQTSTFDFLTDKNTANQSQP